MNEKSKKTSAAHYGCVMLCYCFMLKLSGWINMCKPLNLEFYALIRLSRIDLRALFSWSHTSTALNELNGANVYAGCHNEQTWELFRMKVARSQQWASPFMTLNHTNYFSEEKHHKKPRFFHLFSSFITLRHIIGIYIRKSTNETNNFTFNEFLNNLGAWLAKPWNYKIRIYGRPKVQKK